MERVGVEAVVAGLSSFLGDMKKMDSAISGLVPGTKLLENAFGFLGNTIDGFVNFTLNTLAHALGELIADAIEFVIQKIGELIQATIEAGSEFQALELRLQTLNFNSLTESGMEYNEATAEAIRLTKEQLEWLQKLAVTTPYDAADIANVFTLARSYGFVDEEARTLTETISNFAAGMGLGNVEIERIIVNFGQMVQQGKVTQREMNDLARGAFVPVNDVLALMQKNLGMSSAELAEFRQTGEGVDAFMQAFIELVEQRFSGSAEKMARTFQGATANMQDLIKSIVGMNIIKPILDIIGGRIADFISQLTAGDKWDKLTEAAEAVGNAIYVILNTLLQFLPDASSVADGIIAGLNGIADWLNEHRSDITNWIIEASRWINNVLIPDIKNVLKWLFGTEEEDGAIQKFGAWIWEVFIPGIKSAAQWGTDVLIPFLKNDLLPVFIALLPLAVAIGDVLIGAFGGAPNQSLTDWIHNALIPGIEKFTEWIVENKDQISFWVGQIVTATINLALLAGVVSLLVGLITDVVAAFLNWFVLNGLLITGTGKFKGGLSGLFEMAKKLGDGFRGLFTVAKILGDMFEGLFHQAKILGDGISALFDTIAAIVTTYSEIIIGLIRNFIDRIIAIFLELYNRLVGHSIIPEMMDDILQVFHDFFLRIGERMAEFSASIQNSFIEMLNGVVGLDWVGAGMSIINGLISGIQSGVGGLIDAAQNAALAAYNAALSAFGGGAGASIPVAPGSVHGTPKVPPSRSTTNNYNLNINSSAATEPIVQDFNMLSSIGGR